MNMYYPWAWDRTDICATDIGTHRYLLYIISRWILRLKSQYPTRHCHVSAVSSRLLECVKGYRLKRIIRREALYIGKQD